MMAVLCVVSDKYLKLEELLKGMGSCVVAYSGGVDSVFLAHVAHRTLGARALAVIADSPSLPRREFQEAIELAGRFGFPVRVVKTNEFDDARYVANPENRCYYCKHELFSELVPVARAEGFAAIVYGENASDIGDHRPGAKAAAEFQVRAPLKEAGLTKVEIRELSARFGLPTADKPQMACLSSRVPYGETVTPEKLRMIESAENVLRDLGFHDVRVRHHELSAPGSGHSGLPRLAGRTHMARIEVGSSELTRFFADGVALRAAEKIKEAGYTYVTVDLQGYRRGSANEARPGVGQAV
jgi:uncharacterized protein